MTVSGVAHLVICLFVLLFCLLHLDAVDFYAEQALGEVLVEMEDVAIVHLASFGLLGHHPYLYADAHNSQSVDPVLDL